MSLSKSDTEIILNKANIALARSQRLVASWLPTQPQTDDRNAKTVAELQQEEDEVFTAVPETLGVGAPLPSKAADGSWNRTEIDSNDQLRRQLLGRNYKKVMAEKARQKGTDSSLSKDSGSKGVWSQNSGDGKGDTNDDDDGDDEGRTASIGKKTSSKKRKVEVGEGSEATNRQVKETTNDDMKDIDREISGNPKTGTSQPKATAKGRKKTTSFLDEIIAERSKKRKKR
ncbi:hypothetical protein BJY04DRAFT_222227 [Aspergillus karnatakaensis]|uniref:DUF3245 domain-containing protein n=1 Tax=Aspergillus karnatakaensis TaxID=1810916 RepID=UPI003CCD7002